ncbi:MAG: AraC family transcriptional regulator [Bacteroidales bacterium]|nr:AraC family transcriptional regulator [Bacteroidales bacterium]
MKPALRRVTPHTSCSFNIRKDKGANIYMYSMWHYHPEVELLFISGGKGIQIVGDKTDNISEPQHLIMLGSHLPHTIAYDNISEQNEAEAIVIHFNEDFLGKDFLNLPEMENICELFRIARVGLSIKGETLTEIGTIMAQMLDASPVKRLFSLLQILQIIAEQKEYSFIASEGFACDYSGIDNSRISKIYRFTFENFSSDISVTKAADQLRLSKESFCRYFKQKTGKTYFQFLTEVRIGHACKLLMENEMNVTEICAACGYKNASNFHHQFKEIVKKTPLQYQKEYFACYRGSKNA